jgi:amino acid adenylation domain-containing protein
MEGLAPGENTLDDALPLTIVAQWRWWVVRTPDAPAVEHRGVVIRYADLAARANRLAGALREAGIRRGGIVALRLEDPVELITGMLATVIAGGAYLAIDGELPGERLAMMLEDAGPQLMVTARRGEEPAGMPQLAIDAPGDIADGAAHAISVEPDDLACVFFTSGSSGRPKGVPLPHRGVARLFRGHPPMDLAAGSRMAHAAHVMFDATTLEIWGPLLQGGTVVCLPRHALLDPHAIAPAIRAHRLDALFATTALFREIVLRAPDAFAGLTSLYVGGEALDARSAEAVLRSRRETGGPVRFRNLYGPTETTTLATWFEVTRGALEPEAVAAPDRRELHVPIGSPVLRTAVHVLDDELRPVADHEIGELYVAGDGLGPGYLRRPGLTAARFVPDPWAERPGARMYRTGDLARRRCDGALVFCGRRDRQVKIRGFRIELEDIEAVLGAHPEVRGCAVEVARGPGGQDHLVAHAAAPRELADELRGWLARRLPPYMVPARVVTREHLPVTAGGKLDRAALASGHEAPPGAPGRPAEPRSGDTADLVAEIWARVLGVAEVDRARNFFDLGGSSLLLLEVQAHLEERTGRPVAVRDLFVHPTVVAQAALLDGTAPSAPVSSALAPARASARRRRRAALAQLERDATACNDTPGDHDD